MPGISVITNFDVNANAPIDSRMVVSNSTARNAIQYLYSGLRVYQLSDQKSYLWNGTTWSLDTGGNGIYGGSGSLVGRTHVSFGTIGNTASNQSYIFQYDTNSVNGSAVASMMSYFVRHSNVSVVGTGHWRTIEYRNQLRVTDSGVVGEGPWISFNPIDTLNRRGGIAFATGEINVGGSSTIQERVRINTDGYMGIGTNDPKAYFQIGDSSDYPINIDLINTTKSQISSNWWNNGGSDDVFDLTKGSSKIIVDSSGSISINCRDANASKSDYNPTLYLAKNIFRSINDISANLWDANVNVDYQMRSIPDYVHNSEHRYTKIQSENWYQLSSTAYNNTNKTLEITDDANNFEISITASSNRYITDIKILRNGAPSTVQNGTRINVRFKHSNTPNGTNNFYIKLAQSEADISSNIRSAYSDMMILGNTYSIRVDHDPNSSTNWAGDVVTFVKANGNKWDIVNVDRQKQILDYLGTSSRSFPLSEWDFTDAGSFIGHSTQNNTAAMQIQDWQFYGKRLGNTILVDYQIRLILTQSTITTTGIIKPSATNPIYGKRIQFTTYVPSLGFTGPSLGVGPFSTHTNLIRTVASHGFEFVVTRINYATNGATAFIGSAQSQYLCGQMTINLT